MSYWKAVNKYVTLLHDPPVRIQIAKIFDFQVNLLFVYDLILFLISNN